MRALQSATSDMPLAHQVVASSFATLLISRVLCIGGMKLVCAAGQLRRFDTRVRALDSFSRPSHAGKERDGLACFNASASWPAHSGNRVCPRLPVVFQCHGTLVMKWIRLRTRRFITKADMDGASSYSSLAN